jgi:hypothetical protein
MLKTITYTRTALTVLLLMLNAALFGQNINGKLGTSGQFIIRDTNNTFLSISQTTGDLSLNRSVVLPVSTAGSQVGSIFKGTVRFIHNYAPVGVVGNTFVGINAGNFTMNGVGSQSGFNTGVGMNSLAGITTGSENSSFGLSSLNSNSNGSENSAFGVFTLGNNSSGYQNCAYGNRSMNNNNSGIQNSAFGYHSLYSNTAGFQNTAIGENALLVTTGNYNTAIGYNSGSTITSGANLTCIGIDAAPTTPTALDQITLGNTFVSSLRCNVTTITSLSDARDKKNIKDLSLGINFLMKLKPRLYNWDKREWYDDNVSDGSKMREAPTAGFIAQELDEVQLSENAEWLNLVLKDNPEKLEATPGNLLPIVVKSIQDLKNENDGLKTENNELKERLSKLEQIQNMLALEIKNIKSKGENLMQVQYGN